jgi:hypothetical protein
LRNDAIWSDENADADITSLLQYVQDSEKLPHFHVAVCLAGGRPRASSIAEAFRRTNGGLSVNVSCHPATWSLLRYLFAETEKKGITELDQNPHTVGISKEDCIEQAAMPYNQKDVVSAAFKNDLKAKKQSRTTALEWYSLIAEKQLNNPSELTAWVQRSGTRRQQTDWAECLQSN